MEKYWNQYSDKLYYFFYKRIRDKEVAKDLVQDTFQTALANRKKFEQVNNPEAWLMKVGRNRLIDYTRKVREQPLETDIPVDEEGTVSEKNRVIEGISECLYELIDEYDEVEKELLIEVFTKSMTQKEIAEYLDIPYSTLKSRIQKSRDHILNEFRKRCCTLRRNRHGEIIGCIPVAANSHTEC